MVHFRLRNSILEKFKTGEHGKPLYRSAWDEIKASLAPKPEPWWRKISKPTPIKLRPKEELEKLGLLVHVERPHLSLMSDPRVRRGRSQQVLRNRGAPSSQVIPSRRYVKRYSDGQKDPTQIHITRPIPGTPPLRSNRQDEKNQTDLYVEELLNEDQQVYIDNECQTLPLYDFPPMHNAGKSDDDAMYDERFFSTKATQVEDPIASIKFDEKFGAPLKTLCHNIISKSLMELMEKYERQLLDRSSGKVELSVEKLQEKIRKVQVREEMVRNELERLEIEQIDLYNKKRSLSAQLAGGGMFQGDSEDQAEGLDKLKRLENLGDPQKVAVRKQLIPWLNKKVKQNFQVLHDSYDILDEMLMKMAERRGFEHCYTHKCTEDGDIMYANKFDEFSGNRRLAMFCDKFVNEVQEREEFLESVYSDAAKKLKTRKSQQQEYYGE